ncbi:MAG: hypothetical protein NVS1B12_15330 [Acidimicrobiales bacterium]
MPETVTPTPSRRGSTPKRSAREAWADWRASGTAASATVFCSAVSSWLEGTSAQLVRPLWPTGGVRPSLADVQARLRRGLSTVLSQEADYVEALAAARRIVAQELGRARSRDSA